MLIGYKLIRRLSREFGVQGTPSFFINEKNFPGAYNFSDMQATVDEALK
jgi:protein-disulfide isomerase